MAHKKILRKLGPVQVLAIVRALVVAGMLWLMLVDSTRETRASGAAFSLVTVPVADRSQTSVDSKYPASPPEVPASPQELAVNRSQNNYPVLVFSSLGTLALAATAWWYGRRRTLATASGTSHGGRIPQHGSSDSNPR